MRTPTLLLTTALSLSACIGDPPAPGADQTAKLAPYVLDAAPESATKTKVDYGGKVTLVAYDVEPKQAEYPPGTEVRVSLYWKCEAAVGDGWMLFTHLVDHVGRKLDNLDSAGPLRAMEGVSGQPLPPAKWQPGKVYKDELRFVIPPDPSPAVFVGAGIYKGQARLPIVGAGGDREKRSAVVKLSTGSSDVGEQIPEISVPMLAAGTAISIDGKLDEPAWASAPSTGAFVDPSTGREAPSSPLGGKARLAWDSAHFYVAIEARDSHVRGGWPPDAKDPHLWEKDTVEIMVDPDGDGDNKDYYEIQINPQNLVFDTRFDGYNRPNGGPGGPFGHQDWSAKLTSAVVVRGTIDDDGDRDEGYVVEAKIPWASFDKAKTAPPRPGDAWRINFYAMQDNGGTSWSPILRKGNFHFAPRFGRVRWTK